MKIVVIDDESDICFILGFELKAMGHQTVSFTSAVEAKEYFISNTADAIICDFQMPIMNGYELFLWLKNQDINIPFYILTGEPTMDCDELIRCGVQQVLFKPHDLITIPKIFKQI